MHEDINTFTLAQVIKAGQRLIVKLTLITQEMYKVEQDRQYELTKKIDKIQ